MSLCFNNLTDAPWPHSILGSEREFVPGATFEVLEPIGTLAWTDGEVSPLLAVVLRVLQNVALKRAPGVNNFQKQTKTMDKEESQANL